MAAHNWCGQALLGLHVLWASTLHVWVISNKAYFAIRLKSASPRKTKQRRSFRKRDFPSSAHEGKARWATLALPLGGI